MMVLWAILALAALLLVALGDRGKMDVHRGRCVRCRHELHDPLPPRCGECGAELSRRDAIAWGQPAPRRPLLVAGLITGAIASFAVPATAFLRSAGWASRANVREVVAMSPAELIAALAPPDQAAKGDPGTAIGGSAQAAPRVDQRTARLWSGVRAALDAGEFSDEQLMAVAEAAGRYAREFIGRSGSVFVAPVEILSDIATGRRLSDEEVAEVFRRIMDDLELLGPIAAAAGDEVFLVPNSILTELNWLAGSRFGLAVTAVFADGVEVPIIEPRPRASSAVVGGTARMVHPKAVVIERPGVAELHVEVSLVLDRSASLASGPGAAPAGSDGAVTAGLASIPLRRMVHRVEVLPLDEPLPRTLADPGLVDAMKSAIDLQLAIALDVDGRHHVVQATIEATPLLRCAMVFLVSIVIPSQDSTPDAEADEAGVRAASDAEAELPLGMFRVGQRPYEAFENVDFGRAVQPVWTTLSAWAPEALLGADRVTVRLTPVSAHGIDARTADHRWDLPLIFEQVPLKHVLRGGGER